MHFNRLQQALGFSRVVSEEDTDAEPIYEETEITPAGFASLPEHLLEQIFRKLRHSGRKTLFAVCGVCFSWRKLGQPLFFPKPWDSHHLICHPNQLFCLSPRPLRYSESRSGLLRCFVRREPSFSSSSSSSSFTEHYHHHRHLTFWLGKGPSRSSVRFLMSALKVSRTKTLIFLNPKATGKPCAILTCNIFGTKYSLRLAGLQLYENTTTTTSNSSMVDTIHEEDKTQQQHDEDTIDDDNADDDNGTGSGIHHLHSSTSTHTNNDVLVQLEYKARIRGFMQPRRMKVSLPHPSTMQCGDPSSLPTLTASSTSNRVGTATSTRHDIAIDEVRTTTTTNALVGVAHRSSSHQTLMMDDGDIIGEGSSTSATGRNITTTTTATTTNNGELLPSGSGRMSRYLLKAWRKPQDLIQRYSSSGGGGGVKTAPLPPGTEVELKPVILKNKGPHWNDDLRCWCLNFRGRVKLASVKNFQLVVADDNTEKITMQFGRVDKGVFILDFNPTKMSAIQAFAVALSTFDSKVML